MKTVRLGGVCSMTRNGKAMGNGEALQDGDGGGGGRLELVLWTQSWPGGRTGRRREAKILGSFHVGPPLVSSSAGTCSLGGLSCVLLGSSLPRR